MGTKWRAYSILTRLPVVVSFVLLGYLVSGDSGVAVTSGDLRGLWAASAYCASEDNNPSQVDDSAPGFIREGNFPMVALHDLVWVPMPYEDTALLEDGDFALRWHICFEGYDRSDPPRLIQLGLTYYPATETTAADLYAEVDRIWPTISHTFTSLEPLFSFVEYLREHEDVFFDYSEFAFQDLPSDWDTYARASTPEIENFSFSVDPWAGNEVPSICKFAELNDDTPKEIFLAIEKIKLLFTDPILGQSPPANRAPVCDLEDVDDYETEYGTPVTVTFDATNTYDLDFDTLTYAWDFDGDEVYGENPDDNYSGNPDTPTRIYDLPIGVHNLTDSVKVTDPDNAESICSTSFTITVEMTEAR
jgi:hypothetical protein